MRPRSPLLPPLLAAAPLLFAGCNLHSNGHSGHWTSFTGDGVMVQQSTAGGGDLEVKARWSEGNTTTEVLAAGEVHFTPDDLDVAAFDGAGFVQAEQSGPLGTRRLDVRKVEGNQLMYLYQENGVPADYHPAARAWFGEVVQQLIARTPVGARARAARLRQQGGSEALLAAAQAARHSAAQKIYFTELLRDPGADRALLVRIVESAAASLSSDSALCELLGSAARYRPEDEDLSLCLIGAVQQIGSDSSRTGLIGTLAAERSLTAPVTAGLLRAAGQLSSSSNACQALAAVLERAPAEPATYALYIEQARGISSSSSQQQAYQALLELPLDVPNRVRLAEALAEIVSSSTKSALLAELLDSEPYDPAVSLACLEATKEVTSSSEMERVVRAALELPELDGAVLAKITEVVDAIPSTHSQNELRGRIIAKLVELQDAERR